MNAKPPFLDEIASTLKEQEDVGRHERFDDSRPAPERGLDRLMRAVDRPPLRYAPFFASLGAMFDLPEPELVRQLQGLNRRFAWRWSWLRGVRTFAIDPGPSISRSFDAALLHLAPGITFPRHVHPTREAVLVIEGSFTDDRGTLVGPGQTHEMEAGTSHKLFVGNDEPCVAAVVVGHGLRFESWFRRWR